MIACQSTTSNMELLASKQNYAIVLCFLLLRVSTNNIQVMDNNRDKIGLCPFWEK